MATISRKYFLITGQVQGVGFRPFVYRQAKKYSLTGTVGNTPEGVRIEIQGSTSQIDAFEHSFYAELPPLARITSTSTGHMAMLPDENDFEIIMSHEGDHAGHAVLVSPDMAVCESCLADMLDPANRRYGYPFTNCTDCGPRYSITRSIPYDRPVTSMACFPLCPACTQEYGDPMNRRFHAQPNACAECGPEIWVEYNDTRTDIPGLLKLLKQGKIAAIKGLGGFHLVCDALNPHAVATLRQRKNRPHKALAVMVSNLEQARLIAHISPQAERMLLSPEKPIVICPRRADGPPRNDLAPDSGTIGIVLPYTPLHHLLFHPEALGGNSEDALPVLVMTSGNAGGEPICLGNREAKSKLGHIADVFLFHNRDILVRVDDSVVLATDTDCPGNSASEKYVSDSPIFLRRARGYVPSPQILPASPNASLTPPTRHSILAVGAEMKHTFCLTRGQEAFVSQHIGELNSGPALDFFEETLAHLSSLLETKPQAVIRDMHPDYLSSRLAEDFGKKHGIPVLSLQHHFAHVYAVMAEHCITEPVLGLALDGSGLGTDGSIWGGELLLASPTIEQAKKAEGNIPSPGIRLGHLRPFALPGGEAAIRAPWRIAEALLSLIEKGADQPAPHKNYRRFWEDDTTIAATVPMLQEIIARQLNCPQTSSCGRLFDAVSALCGFCFQTTYEGQAAIRLEQQQDHTETGHYILPLLPPFSRQQAPASTEDPITGPIKDLANAPLPLIPDTWEFFRQAAVDIEQHLSPQKVARKFHKGLAIGLAQWVEAAAQQTGIRRVVLCGGVMNNRTLATELPPLLLGMGITPLLAWHYPPGDGSISLGQAYWGSLQTGMPKM